LVLAVSYFLSGCATVPVVETLPTYTINGATYFPVVTLCQQKGITWDYDTYSRTITLRKNGHKVNLRVRDNLALVDGNSEHLSNPVDSYHGAVVAPLNFKERLLDVLGREGALVKRVSLVSSGIVKVVVDAGHGGNDPGAIGRSGLKEKDVNLDVAKRLAKLLKDEGVQVVFTRSSDTFIPLPRRVDITNRSGADLFVSIHSNANRVRSMKGFEVYYVSPASSDLKRAVQAAQSANLDVDRSCFASNSSNLKTILWDMLYGQARAESIELAKDICKTIGKDMDLNVIGVKSANYFVLKGAQMPAVLIEIGFVSNQEEEKMLKNSYYRQQIAEAIYSGIEGYARDYALLREN